MIKIFKNINFIKKIINKNFYALCVIKKNHLIFHKIYIRLKKKKIYIDIYNFIIFYKYYNNKYFIIFLNN